MFDINKYKKTGNFKLSSGDTSNVYYDIKEAMGEPQNLLDMTSNIESRIKERPDLIIGLEYGGIPLAISLSLKLNIPYAILRKESKKHGTQNRIEGYQGKGSTLIVDDVKTTGNSMWDALKYLKGEGYHIIQMESYFNRREKCNHEYLPCECGCGIIKCFHCERSKMEINDELV